MRFTDCIDITGESCKKFVGKKIYISTGAVDVDHVDLNQIETVNYDTKPSRANLITDDNSILFAKMQETKKVLFIDKGLEKNIYSTGFFSVSPKKNILNKKCLYHLLESKTFLSQKDKYCSGATQKSITLEGLNKIEITIPNLEDQDKIVKILDSIKVIIESYKKEIKKYDELIKARFIEMFGTLDDPADEFEKATLKKLCNKITDGKHGGCTSEDGTQRYFVGAREIYDDEVHYDTAPEINVEEFEKDYKRCNIEIGDFLIVNTGATIGKSAIASDERTEHTLLQKSVALLKIKKDKLNPVFLKWCYRVNTRMYMVQSASAQPNLLLSKINGTVIYVPSIERQNQFADFVQQVDKSRFDIKKSITELEREVVYD